MPAPGLSLQGIQIDRSIDKKHAGDRQQYVSFCPSEVPKEALTKYLPDAQSPSFDCEAGAHTGLADLLEGLFVLLLDQDDANCSKSGIGTIRNPIY